MIRIIKRWKYVITIILFVIVIVFLCFLKFNLLKEKDNIVSNMDIVKDSVDIEKEMIEEENKKIRVDIKGAINNPSVYEIDTGSRVIDLINIAGGLKDNADTSLINLSKILSDEMVIYIYTKEEVRNSNLVNTVIKVIEKECVCPNIENDGCINDKIEDTISNKPSNDNNETSDNNDSHLININNASLDELMTIPGIGKQKAEAIIKYRKDNKFNSIEDITNVSGIGNPLYESIKAYITV